MSELVDIYELDDRLHVACSNLANIPLPRVLILLQDLQAYMGWTVVQDAMKEAKGTQKMCQELLKEMD
jgi:hypothetical protein